MSIEGNTSLRALQSRLPPNWALEWRNKQVAPELGDAVLTVRAADGRTSRLVVEAKRNLDPRGVIALTHARKVWGGDMPVLVVAPYLSESTRSRLREEGFAYADDTGNVWFTLESPGLFIETHGADANPSRADRPARSLKGQKAGRVVRALCDYRQPPGVRELAARADVDAGYVSRILRLLDTEALVERDPRGVTNKVEWEKLLRRWAEESPLSSRGRTTTFLEPRGLASLQKKLSGLGERGAVTGSLAAARISPVASPRLATVYVDDAESFARDLGLRATDSGANVMLIEPDDDGVFVRASEVDGVRYVAPSQAAADLLTSPGRGPAEADELLRWMSENEEVWRG